METSGMRISRRRMLKVTVAGVTMAVAGHELIPSLHAEDAHLGDAPVDAHRLVLLSDTHIAADPRKEERGVVMADNFRTVVAQIAAMSPRPACVIIDGDQAHHTGEAADYATWMELIRPLLDRRLPLGLTLGNHDHREHFRAAAGAILTTPVTHDQPWHVSWIQLQRATLVMLDSLEKVNKVPGLLGEGQLALLDQLLQEAAGNGKPTLVFLHHPPTPDPPDKTQNLRDHEAFWAVVDRHPHVKAVVYGHIHRWEHSRRGHVHLVSLPPTAYVFRAGQPSGYVLCDLHEDKLQLTIRTIGDHPVDGQSLILPYDTA